MLRATKHNYFRKAFLSIIDYEPIDQIFITYPYTQEYYQGGRSIASKNYSILQDGFLKSLVNKNSLLQNSSKTFTYRLHPGNFIIITKQTLGRFL